VVKIEVEDIIDEIDKIYRYMERKDMELEDKLAVVTGLLNNINDEIQDDTGDNEDDDYDDIDQVEAGLSDKTKQKAGVLMGKPPKAPNPAETYTDDEDEDEDDDEPDIMPVTVKKPKAEVKGGTNKKGK